jgi:hypothetical protein
MQRSRIRTATIGGLAVVVAVIATAIALGGSPAPSPLTSKTLLGKLPATVGAVPSVATPHSHGAAGTAPSLAPEITGTNSAGGAGSAQSPETGSTTASGGSTAALAAPQRAIDSAAGDSGSSVTATRIVKTGNLDLRVAKGAVASTVSKLSALASAKGGYVARSTTNTGSADPSGAVELRVPVGQFGSAVGAAEALGTVESLTTSAHDVTGKYVDLRARENALQRTRATYLTILSRATTIGATLSVQQRIDDVQQQIEELQGEIKLLASQSSYSTLDVNVDQAGAIALVKPHHKRHGLSKAWHTSVSRFDHGIDTIVSGLGPLLLAILLIGFAIAVARLGMRGAARRNRSPDPTG